MPILTQHVELLLPTPPNRANSTYASTGSRRWLYKKHQQEYFNLCILESLGRKKFWSELLPFEAIEYTTHFEVGGYYDFDNLCSLLKWPMDYLMKDGWIISDDWFHARPRHIPKQTMKRNGSRYLTMKLYPRLPWEKPLKRGTKRKLLEGVEHEEEIKEVSLP